MIIQIVIPDDVEQKPAAIVGKALQDLLTICQQQNMSLDMIADFLDLSARSLRIIEDGVDPLKETTREAAKIAVLAQSGLLRNILPDDDDEDEEPGEIEALLDDLPEMPILEKLGDIDDRFITVLEGRGSASIDEIRETLKFIDTGVTTFIENWSKTGKKYALIEDEWRDSASEDELADEENYLFLDDLRFFHMENTAFAVSHAIAWAAIENDRPLFDAIAAALTSSKYAFFVLRNEDLKKAIKEAKRAFDVHGKFMRELMTGLDNGGIKQSQFLDTYAEIRDIAETWVKQLVDKNEIEIVKKGGRLTIVRPIE